VFRDNSECLMDVKLRTLLIVVVLTAIATTVAQSLTPSRKLRPVALVLDLVPWIPSGEDAD